MRYNFVFVTGVKTHSITLTWTQHQQTKTNLGGLHLINVEILETQESAISEYNRFTITVDISKILAAKSQNGSHTIVSVL